MGQLRFLSLRSVDDESSPFYTSRIVLIFALDTNLDLLDKPDPVPRKLNKFGSMDILYNGNVSDII